jgi:hypothetical protein
LTPNCIASLALIAFSGRFTADVVSEPHGKSHCKSRRVLALDIDPVVQIYTPSMSRPNISNMLWVKKGIDEFNTT